MNDSDRNIKRILEFEDKIKEIKVNYVPRYELKIHLSKETLITLYRLNHLSVKVDLDRYLTYLLTQYARENKKALSFYEDKNKPKQEVWL